MNAGITVDLWGNVLEFQTHQSAFSPKYADPGTLAMLSAVDPAACVEGTVLDLGCGYGLVGIAMAKVIGDGRVVMIDNDPQAVALSKTNAARNGVGGIRILCGDALSPLADDETFSLILCNPPYHEDFGVPKRFIEQSFRHLRMGGALVMVVKRLTWYRNKLHSIFGAVTVRGINDYHVLTAEKRTERPPPKTKPDPTKKHQKRVQRSKRRPQ
jgi:16S rRNA (guanine1207-N2)-methyltransferase